jgi:hypothetical protein
VFSEPFTYLNHHFSDFLRVAFFDAQEAKYEFAWPFDTLKHPFIDFKKVVFKTSRSQIMSSQAHSPT